MREFHQVRTEGLAMAHKPKTVRHHEASRSAITGTITTSCGRGFAQAGAVTAAWDRVTCKACQLRCK